MYIYTHVLTHFWDWKIKWLPNAYATQTLLILKVDASRALLSQVRSLPSRCQWPIFSSHTSASQDFPQLLGFWYFLFLPWIFQMMTGATSSKFITRTGNLEKAMDNWHLQRGHRGKPRSPARCAPSLVAGGHSSLVLKVSHHIYILFTLCCKLKKMFVHGYYSLYTVSARRL